MRVVHMRKAFGLATLLAVGAATAVSGRGQAQSQPPQQPQRPIFGARIDTVTVDVAVTDRQGRPVTDLTIDDFDVRENRVPQTIDTFKFIEIDDTVDVDPARNREIRSLADQERELQRDDVRVIVIYLDDYHTRLGNSMFMRERLARFVRGLHPRDLVALMTPLMSTEALTFSRNHDATARQIMAFVGRKYDYTPKHPAEEVYQYLTPQQIEMLRNQIVATGLEGLAVYLGTVRDGRKSVLFVSEGMMSSLPPGVRTTGLYGGTGGAAQPPRTLQEQMAAGGAITAGTQASQLQLLDLMKDIFLEASRSNTSFYSLDPRGLAASEFDIADTVDSRADRAALNESMDTLRILSSNTDGRAIVNANDPQPALQQMLRDSSAYYLLGYTSTEAPRDGKFHPIQVEVKRKDVEVRARNGYWAYSEDDIARATAPSFSRPDDVIKAFDAISEPEVGRVFRTWWTAARGTDGRADVTLIWEALRPDREVPDTVTVTASTPDGQLVHRGRAARVPDPLGRRVAGRLTFAAPPGTLLLRFVAENADGDRLDTSEREVAVPNLAVASPVVTTPMIFRARTARDIEALRAADNPLPATVREFLRTERLFVRFQVYMPGGVPASPQLRLMNRNGDVM
jgi:VWFA-related protein